MKIKINIKILKKIFLSISLIYLSIYIPLFLTIYSSNWYEFNYESQGTYDLIEEEKTNNATKNLINFFLHKENLNKNWNEKEIYHMEDVRKIYDFLAILAIISFLIFSKLFDKKKLISFSKINIILISLLSLLLPIFSFFWNKIFHVILFNNDFWIITPNDISYYLFPLSFFINSIILIIFLGIVINFLLIIYLKKVN